MSKLVPTFALGLLLVLGCSDDKDSVVDPNEPVGLPPATTPQILMDNLKASYELEDFDEYSGLFNHDEFEFQFDPTDIQENPEIPASWGWDAESTAAMNMFTNEFVTSIELDYQTQEPRLATEQDGPYPEGTMVIVCSEVALRVTVEDPSGGEDTIYRVDGDRAHFFALPNPERMHEGAPVWEVVHWIDEVVGGSGDGIMPTENTSWGQVKSQFE